MRARKNCSNPVAAAFLIAVSCALTLVPPAGKAGGPLLIGGPAYGIDGHPFIWDPAAMPIQYRTDVGPLASKLDGTVVVAGAAGIARVQATLQLWQDVPTASISFNNAGTIQSTGAFSDGNVSTVEEYDAVCWACIDGTQSPIVFDADGRLFEDLFGDATVIGMGGPCHLNPTTGYIVSGMVIMNGRWQDGVDSPSYYPVNYEMTAAEFDMGFAHEFGHFAGLDHSQINVNVLFQEPGACLAADLAGLPLMFPFYYCQARTTAGLPMLAPDDAAWISRLYPESVNAPPNQILYASRYGSIRGAILFSDGTTHVQGVNVVARDPANPRRIAVSVVAGYLFTGYPGQEVTGDSPGYALGSRNPLLYGAYEIPVPGGTYTVEVESVFEAFDGGSSVGPLSPPIPNPGANEFWDVNESATDSTAVKSNVSVSAGGVVSEINIILNGTPSRFDSFESARLWWHHASPALLREEDLLSLAHSS